MFLAQKLHSEAEMERNRLAFYGRFSKIEAVKLVNLIRSLQQKVEELIYEEHLLFCKLIDKANAQNLYWW